MASATSNWVGDGPVRPTLDPATRGMVTNEAGRGTAPREGRDIWPEKTSERHNNQRKTIA